MGNYYTKTGEEITDQNPIEGSVPSTPILTPKARNLKELDPRSPSMNVIRTPIETIIASSRDLEDEQRYDTFTLTSPGPKPIVFDPRSPSYEFNRTPIILPNNDNEVPKILRNKNLDNVRNTVIIPLTPKHKTDYIKITPPKLLASSPLTSKPIENKRKSLIGVLETNLDYVETNLDDVIQKISLHGTQKQDSIHISTEEEFEKEEVLEILKKSEDVTELKDLTIDDDGLIIKHTNVINSTEIVNDEQIIPKLADLQLKIPANLKDFDAKLSHLIYSDNEPPVKPMSISPLTENKSSNPRTPLAEHNREVQKKTQVRPKLCVSDKPRIRTELGASKIPVFKDKSKRTGAAVGNKAAHVRRRGIVQCENTPPRSKVTDKRTAKWDNDNTLVI